MNVNKRKIIRLHDYDYSSEGGYFITIVTADREPLFGKIINEIMVLNEFGTIVREEWLQTGSKRKNVELYEDEFCIMPNHFHAIIWIVKKEIENLAWQGDTTERHGTPCPYESLGSVKTAPRVEETAGGHGTPCPCGSLGSSKTATRLGDMARYVPKTGFGKPAIGSLSTIIGAFKSAVTRSINVLRGVEGEMVWQSRFYDHIIRDEKDYYAILEYIALNPASWEKDEDFVKDFD